MEKQQSPPKKGEVSLGKGKVTPVQIAFIVDRYLADSGFSATLASFRSEAADLFSKTRNREVPRGLLSLAEILDDYVSLKEQRILVDQEKHRVDAVLRGIQGAMQAYHSAGGYASVAAGPPLPGPFLPSPSLPTPPPAAAAAAARPLVLTIPSNSSNRSPPGPKVHNVPLLRSPPPLLPSNAAQPGTFSTPVAEASCNNKRKNSKPTLKAPAAPKKHRGRLQTEVSTSEGITPPSELDDENRIEETIQKLTPDTLASNGPQNTNLSVHGSSVVKSLFKQLPGCKNKTISTSPKTPPKASSSQVDKMASPIESLSISQHPVSDVCKASTPSKCSVIASRTVVVSPLRNKGYYAVEKTYCISSSPMKSNTRRQVQRDNVKGRLDFDDTDKPICCAKPAAAEASTSSPDDAVEDIFDLDLPDLDIDFSFSELLVNIDLDCELDKSSQLASTSSADFISGPEDESGGGSLAISQKESACLRGASGIICEKGMKVIQGIGDDSVTSVKAVTKCIKIVSPAKSRSNPSIELVEKHNRA